MFHSRRPAYAQTYSRNLRAPRQTFAGPKVMASKFPGTCKRCGARIAAGEQIAYEPGNVTHATQAQCDAAKAQTPTPAAVATPAVNLSAVVALLVGAKGPKLQYPSVSLIAPHSGRAVKLTLASERAKFPGAVNVLLQNEWIGRVLPNGEVHGRQLSTDAALVAFLVETAGSPEKLAAAAKVYAVATSSCSFCAKELTDLGSIEVGYGPVCAKHYGLPHKAKGTKPVEISAAASGQRADFEFNSDELQAELGPEYGADVDGDGVDFLLDIRASSTDDSLT